MKKLIPLLAFVFLLAQAGAQTTEYLPKKDFQVEKKKIFDGINASKKQVNEIKKSDARMELSIDSLKRALANTAGQLAMVTDSLSKTGAKLNALQEKVDSQKMLSKGARILIFVILVLLFILIFAMLFLLRKKAETNHQLLFDANNKTNERLDVALDSVKTDVQSCRSEIHQVSTHLKTQLSTFQDVADGRSKLMEKQMEEGFTGIEGKINSIRPEISSIRDGQAHLSKTMEEKLNALKKEEELRNQGLANQAARLEEEIKVLKARK